jgi:hypothetical protein
MCTKASEKMSVSVFKADRRKFSLFMPLPCEKIKVKMPEEKKFE